MNRTFMRSLVAFAFFASVATLAQHAAAEVRVALVIGNAEYAEAPLANPVNDAADVAQALRTLGFRVILRRNANQREMRAAVREFAAELRRADVGLFYFAGHGLQIRGNNYLIPVAADIQSEADVEDLALDANYVVRTMEDSRIPVGIVIMDACRNNPFGRGFRSASRGLAQMNAATGQIIAFSTAPGSVAADGTGRNGTYTKHLLASLQHSDSDILRVFQRVRANVVKETGRRQVPWESTSLVGDFFFRRDVSPRVVAAPVEPPIPTTPLAAPAPKSEQTRSEPPVEVAVAPPSVTAERPTVPGKTEHRVFAYDGFKYEGEFRDNAPNGRGTMVYPTGDRYQGQFVDGARHGRGAMVFANGERYEGEWKNDAIIGRGTMRWPNGDRYEGELVNGVRNGRGVMVYADGGRYEGEWRDNYSNGKGVMLWPNGQRYEGQWVMGNRHGYGTHDLAPGRRIEGEWRDDKPVNPPAR